MSDLRREILLQRSRRKMQKYQDEQARVKVETKSPSQGRQETGENARRAGGNGGVSTKEGFGYQLCQLGPIRRAAAETAVCIRDIAGSSPLAGKCLQHKHLDCAQVQVGAFLLLASNFNLNGTLTTSFPASKSRTVSTDRLDGSWLADCYFPTSPRLSIAHGFPSSHPPIAVMFQPCKMSHFHFHDD